VFWVVGSTVSNVEGNAVVKRLGIVHAPQKFVFDIDGVRK